MILAVALGKPEKASAKDLAAVRASVRLPAL
jgi:hypothetical protein